MATALVDEWGYLHLGQVGPGEPCSIEAMVAASPSPYLPWDSMVNAIENLGRVAEHAYGCRSHEEYVSLGYPDHRRDVDLVAAAEQSLLGNWRPAIEYRRMSLLRGVKLGKRAAA
jgi:hypothetical protein